MVIKLNNNSKIAVNSVLVFIRLVVTSVIGILASRIVLDALGAADYGLYNVLGGIVGFLNVMNTAMLSTTYRYIAFELGKGDADNLNKVFNTCFMIHAAIAVVLFLLGLSVGEWYINHYLNVPFDSLFDALFVFRISLLTAVVSILMTPYQGLLVAYEKFHISAFVDILCRVIYFVCIFLVLKSFNCRIRAYSIIQICYTILSVSIYLVYCRRKFFKTVRFFSYKDKHLYKEMLSYAGWHLYGFFATTCQIQGTTLLINFFFGTVVNAAFAVAKQVESFVKQFAYSLNDAAIPQITESFSGGNINRSLNLASYISKYTFMLMSLVAFPVLLEMDFLLGIWLKEVPEGTSVFCKLTILSCLIECLGQGITPLVQATGRVKHYILTIDTLSIVGLPVGWIFFKMGFAQYTISVVCCCVVFVSALLKIFMLRRLLKFDVGLFFKTSYLRIFLISIPLAFGYVFYNSANFSIWQHVIGLICSECYLLIVYASVGLDNNERVLINHFFIKLKRKGGY